MFETGGKEAVEICLRYTRPLSYAALSRASSRRPNSTQSTSRNEASESSENWLASRCLLKKAGVSSIIIAKVNPRKSVLVGSGSRSPEASEMYALGKPTETRAKGGCFVYRVVGSLLRKGRGNKLDEKTTLKKEFSTVCGLRGKSVPSDTRGDNSYEYTQILQ